MIELKIGKTISYKDKKYVIHQILDIDTIVIKEIKTNLFKTIKISELNDNPKSLSLKPIESIEEKYLKIAKERLEIIKPLLESRTKKDVEEIAKKSGKSIKTIYDWIKLYKNSGNNLLALVPNYSQRGGRGKFRISKEQERIAWEIIDSNYLSVQKPSIAHVHELINAKLYEQGLKKISYATVWRMVSQIDERYAFKKREGNKKFANLIEESPNTFEAKYPLEIVQTDHTPLDIQIVDETYRKPIGRPTLTLAIDVYSRMIYGFCLTLEAPGLYSVGKTIYMGLISKENYLKELGIEGEWKIYGIPNTIHVDNAKEFRSKGLETFCSVMGINLEFRPKGRPKSGGHIERAIKTFNIQIHKLKGTTFSNPQERGDYDSEKNAIFTLKELEKYLTEWIVNYYHKKPHKGLNGLTPEEKFQEGLYGDSENPPVALRMLQSEEEKRFAKISLLPFEERTIQKAGVELFGVKYYDESLIPFITPPKSKEKYIFRYDPYDLRKIYFFHPDLKEYIEIPAKKRFLPAISKWDVSFQI
ncbi:Mu transposase C-terminal domain-containing protein [Nitrosophilus labii]|uniref:Mu transposase C-terminal domain-containing protein n=1 Tax=Nitrosophilus labii TaxID=2706014 RepID=UPI001657423F|nr:Mu transposase C-terminal domain-containing protein [Nitrosophilus labii]